MLVLSLAIYKALEEHARSALPREAVGLIWGENGVAQAWTPLENLAEGTAAFRVDEQAFSAALARAPASLLAIVHSHPTEPPIPSSKDMAGAASWRSTIHLILSLADGMVQARAWRLFDGQALPERVCIIDEAPLEPAGEGGTDSWT